MYQIQTSSNNYKRKDVTFSSSKGFAFQRWYPYLEGYSPNFVLDIIRKNISNMSLIYEPFAGTGTTMLAADMMGINTLYSEINPFLRYLIKTKITILSLPAKERQYLSETIKGLANTIFIKSKSCVPSIELDRSYINAFGKSNYFPLETYGILLKLRTYIDNLYEDGENVIGDILSIAICSCLIDVSYMRRQGDLRFMTPKEIKNGISNISQTLNKKLLQISEDIANITMEIRGNHQLITSNAKDIGKMCLSSKISTVITSPPYLNGTNYIRNTKLELWFLKELKNKSDLRVLRDAIITSAICDVKKGDNTINNGLQSERLDKILDELRGNTYDKRIPIMIKSYFEDMHMIFQGLYKNLLNGAQLFIDIGDSIFGGVHIPTDIILSDIIASEGYLLEDKVLLRERKSKNGGKISQVLLQFKLKKNEHC